MARLITCGRDSCESFGFHTNIHSICTRIVCVLFFVINYLPKLSGELLCMPEGPGNSPGKPEKTKE